MRFVPSYLEEDHSKILEEGRQLGIEIGKEQGLANGLEQGLGEALKRILLARFGAVPAALEAELASLPREKREFLIERAAVASSLEEFQTEL